MIRTHYQQRLAERNALREQLGLRRQEPGSWEAFQDSVDPEGAEARRAIRKRRAHAHQDRWDLRARLLYGCTPTP